MNINDRPCIYPMDPEANGGLSDTILGCTFRVSNYLGVGFLEKVCEPVLVQGLKMARLPCEE